MYLVIVDPAAQREFKRFPGDVQDRLIKRLDRIAKAPRAGAKKLKGLKNDWRVRVGKYRILYTVDDTTDLVYIYRIALRSKAYP